MVVEKFVGCYATPPFWAADAPPLFAKDAPETLPKLFDLMSPIVLNRTIGNLVVRVYFDGLIELRRTDLEDALNPKDHFLESGVQTRSYSIYMRLFNALCVCFDIGSMEVEHGSAFHIEELTVRDVCRNSYVDGGFRSGSIAANSVSGYYQLGRFQDSYRRGRPLEDDTRFQQRRRAPVRCLAAGLKHFEKICLDDDLLDQMATFAKALSDFNSANYSTSIVLCWFLLERSLHERYKRFLDQKADSQNHIIDKTRKEFLTGRDFTASIISQLLELGQAISPAELQHLDEIRKFRNNIAHGLRKKLPQRKDGESALRFTLTFVFGHIIPNARVNFWNDQQYPF